MTWTREIDRRWTPNPHLLEDGKAGYQVRIRHVLPTPIPEGSTQFWQVVDVLVIKVKADCSIERQEYHRVDIVGIDGRDRIGDYLMLSRPGDHCVVLEWATHTTGFSDPTANYASQTNVNVPKATADRLKARMRAPTSTFQTTYIFNRDAECCLDFKRLLFWGWTPGWSSPDLVDTAILM